MTLTIAQATTPEGRAACLALRLEVFVREQNVPPEIEIDKYEETALHFLAMQDGEPIATARVVLRDAGRTAKIGRVAVRLAARGQGIGAAMMQALAADPALAACHRLMLESQVHAIGFYERLGYTAFGDIYLDAGIPHRKMELMRAV